MSKKSKISRRNAIKTFALGSSTLAFPKMNRMISSNSKNELLKGNINQSVCQWCYNKMPLEELAKEAREIGVNFVS